MSCVQGMKRHLRRDRQLRAKRGPPERAQFRLSSFEESCSRRERTRDGCFYDVIAFRRMIASEGKQRGFNRFPTLRRIVCVRKRKAGEA